MEQNLQALETLFAANSVWQAEFAGALMTQPESINDTIVWPEAIETVHPYPRIILRPFAWGFDFHLGNCRTSPITIAATVDLVRPLLEDDQMLQLKAQYTNVCEVFRTLMEELSEQSYGLGAPLAHIMVESVGPPEFEGFDEIEIKAADDSQLVNWYCNFLLNAQTT